MVALVSGHPHRSKRKADFDPANCVPAPIAPEILAVSYGYSVCRSASRLPLRSPGSDDGRGVAALRQVELEPDLLAGQADPHGQPPPGLEGTRCAPLVEPHTSPAATAGTPAGT